MTMAQSRSKAHLKFDRNNILTVKADVCICPIHRSKDLKTFNISSQILSAAGSSIQDELYKMSSEELKIGEVVDTEPGQLTNFKKIMFICLLQYKDGNEKYLQQSLLECFELATVYGYTSVALPALGTGGLKYPVEKVAKVTFDAVGLHNEQFAGQCKLQTVNVVLSKDEKDEALVQTYLKICLTGSLDADDAKSPSQSTHSTTGFSHPHSAVPQGSSSYSKQPATASNTSVTKTGPLMGLLGLAQKALTAGMLSFSIGVLKVTVNPSFWGRTVGVSVTVGVDVEILSKFIPEPVIKFFRDQGIKI